MTTERPYLGPALVLSFVLHAALLAAGERLIAPGQRAERAAPAALTVRMHDAPAVPGLQAPESQPPRLLLPQDSPRNASADWRTAAVARQTASLRVLPADAARSAMEQMARELPYPPEAIERGLQGEALVLLFLDASGNVIAARLESSSGHDLLDEAAVRAARTLRALPASAPREALLPVRFRLR